VSTVFADYVRLGTDWPGAIQISDLSTDTVKFVVSMPELNHLTLD